MSHPVSRASLAGAILEYVVHKYGNGRLKPQNDKELAKYLLFLHWAEVRRTC